MKVWVSDLPVGPTLPPSHPVSLSPWKAMANLFFGAWSSSFFLPRPSSFVPLCSAPSLPCPLVSLCHHPVRRPSVHCPCSRSRLCSLLFRSFTLLLCFAEDCHSYCEGELAKVLSFYKARTARLEHGGRNWRDCGADDFGSWLGGLSSVCCLSAVVVEQARCYDSPYQKNQPRGQRGENCVQHPNQIYSGNSAKSHMRFCARNDEGRVSPNQSSEVLGFPSSSKLL